MLLNGPEGIGTGFSSVIPSFNHADICDSMIQYVETEKTKRLRPWVNYYNEKIIDEKTKYIFPMNIEKIGDKFFITELPRGYDAKKIYRHLNKHIEADFLKDYIDSSVSNDIMIELIFKRGKQPTLAEVEKEMLMTSSLTPNYTLISERGVRIFNRPEEIIQIFTEQRLVVVKRRYELLCEEYERRIRQNNEIIKFIRQKEYEVATRSRNRKTFVEHLTKKKFTFSDYLADMPIYRMTKEEVEKRKLLVKDDTSKLKEFEKIAKSDKLVRKKLIEELQEVKVRLNDWLKDRQKEKKELQKKLQKKPGTKTRRS
jgi:DNA gyrase subunit A